MKIEFTKDDLQELREKSKIVGYPEAIYELYDFPTFDLELLKDKAIFNHYDLSTGSNDGFLLERAWLKAIEDFMAQSGVFIQMEFPHIEHLIHSKA